MTVLTKQARRLRRRRRVRAKVSGTAERPRVSVFRSNRGISAQLIDDLAGRTLAAVNWTEAELRTLAGRARQAGRRAAGRAGQGGRRQDAPSSTAAATSTTATSRRSRRERAKRA